MIEVPAVPQSEIDAWPLSEAGLPPRVVNGATRAGIATAGELRMLSARRVAAMPGIGRRSQEAVHAFLRFCRRLNTGAVRFSTVDDVLRQLMHPVEYRALALRYGLNRESIVPGKWPATLRAVGEKQRVTRERARQLIERAKMRVRSRLGRACLLCVQGYFTAFLRDRRDAVTAREIEQHTHPEFTAGTNACGLLRLLCDCRDTLYRRNGYFTTVTPGVLHAIEVRAEAHLRSQGRPVPLDELLAALRLPTADVPLASLEHVVRTVLRNLPSVAATVDDRYFIPGRTAPALLKELFGSDEPQHYRALVHRYNALMCPGSRKGTGFILDTLRHSGRFSRVSPGTYAPLPPDVTEGRVPCA